MIHFALTNGDLLYIFQYCAFILKSSMLIQRLKSSRFFIQHCMKSVLLMVQELQVNNVQAKKKGFI